MIGAPLDLSRRQLGWPEADYAPARTFLAPQPAQLSWLHRRLGPGSVHIFSGLGSYRGVTHSMRAVCAMRPQMVGVMTEPWDAGGMPGLGRSARFRLHGLRWTRQVDFVLATGQRAVSQYAAVLSKSRVVPFGYFVADHDAGADLPDRFGAQRSRDGVDSAFVGRVDDNKRLDWAIRGLAAVGSRDAVLHVVGGGPALDKCKTLAERLGLGSRVIWHGALTNADARRLMSSVDIVVLPSHYDGWGAVVNEALLAGSRTLVSSGAGASVLVTTRRLGRIFDGGDHKSFVHQFATLIDQGPVTPDERRTIATWAHQAISARAGAGYLMSVIESLRSGAPTPSPPWSD